MTKKNALTQRQRDERVRRVAMGLAVIQRPLKQIAKIHGAFGPYAAEARIMANRGNGHAVTKMAWLSINGRIA